MSETDLDPATDPGGMRRVGPGVVVATSARLQGALSVGPGAYVAQGTVVRSHDGAVEIGAGSALLENGVFVGRGAAPLRIGRRTVFGHRCVVVGASVGDLCEIGNGAVILDGAVVGDRCFLGEGTLVPPGAVLDDDSVVLGRPFGVLRTATDDDRARLAALRGGDLSLPSDVPVPFEPEEVPTMGRTYAYRGTTPTIDPTAVLLDAAEVTGDVVIGAGTIVAGGVRIIGDSHGPVRIGARVQIMENTVLHLLPDNELVLEDDVIVGPAAMIHGCRIGAGTVVEPAAIVCDHAVIGAGSLVQAGALVPQRAEHPAGTVLGGFPAEALGTLADPPDLPTWALRPGELPTRT